MGREIIQQGAEAVLFRDGEELAKDRVKKGYRLPELDAKIRRLRTRGESRLLDMASRAGIDVPRVAGVSGNVLKMEFIDGRRVKDALNRMDEKERDITCLLIGESLAKMHGAGICHGDFTTSNMLLKGDKLYVIDFGLGRFSKKAEDQAVDLYLLYEALKAAHFEYLSRSWQYILKSYSDNYRGAKDVMQKFKVIEKRRRYKGD